MKKWLDWDLEGKPWWKIALRGAAIPGLIVAACVCIAVLLSYFYGGNLHYHVKIGIYVGLFFSLYGGIEMMIALLFLNEDIRTNGLLAMGYGVVWLVCLFLIFGVAL